MHDRILMRLLASALFCNASCQAPDQDVQAQSTAAASTAPPFVEFESGQVRPIAMSPNGRMLFAANTPNNSLEIFDAGAGGLSLRARVPVGLEPVAVAARNDGEVWVVN